LATCEEELRRAALMRARLLHPEPGTPFSADGEGDPSISSVQQVGTHLDPSLGVVLRISCSGGDCSSS
jgi:hypothetical protein